MKTSRTAISVLAWTLLAFACAELGLRGAALAWRPAYRSFSRPDSFPVYVVGESTAYGEPFAPKISFPEILSLMFGGRLNGRPLEVVNLALPGSNTEAQYWLLLRELALRPRAEGVVLIYAGINETGQEPPPSRGALLADRSWLLSRFAWLLRGRGCLGLDYEHRLAKLAALGRGYGYPVVLSTLAGNVKDFQPDVSRETIDDPERFAAYARAKLEEKRGRWRAAEVLYAGLAVDGEDPGILHRQARCLLELGEYARARELFQRAVDYGGTKRPTAAQDQSIRRVALRCGAALADSRAVFEAAAVHGLPGRDLFTDAHHPNVRGYLLLAGSFARSLSRLYGVPLVLGRLTEAEVREKTGFSRQDQDEVYASRFIWFCGEAYHRGDPEETLRTARRYLELAERGCGRRLPAYRFLLALAARDLNGIRRGLADQDAVRSDRERLGFLGCNAEWTAQLVKDAGLPKDLESQAQKLMDFAAAVSSCGLHKSSLNKVHVPRSSGKS